MSSHEIETRKKISAAIRDSNHFDPNFYLKQLGEGIHYGEAPEDHYIDKGEKQGLWPAADFDPTFYAEANPDVRSAGINLFYHYIKYGARELRYCNRERLKKDAELLRKSGKFDDKYFKESNSHLQLPGFRSAEQYLLRWRQGAQPNNYFDDRFYYDFYPDVRKTGLVPLLHYIKIGEDEARVYNPNNLSELKTGIEKHFDEAYYKRELERRGINHKGVGNLLDHYVSFGCLNGLDPQPGFNQAYYIERNPDLVKAKVDPFAHYVKYGQREGRKSSFSADDCFEFGLADFSPAKSTILIACHEASKTGAPLLGLGLVQALSADYNVVTSVGRAGPILNDFKKFSYKVLVGSMHKVDLKYMIRELSSDENLVCVIANSIESGDYVLASAMAGIPTLALVHEFAEYTFPVGRMSNVVQLADQVVVPAKLVAESVQKEVKLLCCAPAPNITIVPQGFLQKNKTAEVAGLNRNEVIRYIQEKCPGRDKVVLGAGYVSMRKGVDVFIETAAAVNKIRNDVVFLWVGDGYRPKSDSHYSVWLQEMVERMGLQQCVQFISSQPNLDVLMDVADIFYLSSRLDPFPNVFIDAVNSGLPIVCFDGATGCAEYVNEEGFSGQAVGYCDVVSAAQAILSNLDTVVDRNRNQRLANSLFSFSDYVIKVESFVRDAKVNNEKMLNEVKNIKDSGFFDQQYYTNAPIGRMNIDDAVSSYVRASSKGLSNINPRPGFSDNLFMSYNEAAARPAFSSYMDTHKDTKIAPATHKFYDLNETNFPQTRLRTMLHVHLHYRKMLPDILDRIKSAASEIDLYITVTSSNLLKEVEYELIDWEGDYKTLLVVNQGRDLGPFIVNALPEALQGGYDLIGHIHGKKSLDVSEAFGDNWRKFLFDNLLGDQGNALYKILSIFGAQSNIGLLFPEDRFNVGWGENLSFAYEILSKMKLSAEVPKRPIFPIGSMFWARPEALAPLASGYNTLSDFPIEPLPYDGTILHAIERLLPTITVQQGYSWATIYNAESRR